jgi:hypothetical protein
MKTVLLLSMLMVSTFSFAGDAYLTCFDSKQEIVDSKYLDLSSDKTVHIKFNDMTTDKYYIEVSFNPESLELAYKVFDMNSMLLIEKNSEIVSFYDEVALVSGYTCSLVD